MSDAAEQVKRQHHIWASDEDEKLVECLMDLYYSGKWKANNGALSLSFILLRKRKNIYLMR